MSFKNHNGVHFHSFLWLIVPDKTSLWVQRMPLRSLSNFSSLTFSLNPLGFESLTLGKKTVSIHLIYTSHDLAHPFGLLHSKEKKIPAPPTSPCNLHDFLLTNNVHVKDIFCERLQKSVSCECNDSSAVIPSWLGEVFFLDCGFLAAHPKHMGLPKAVFHQMSRGVE